MRLAEPQYLHLIWLMIPLIWLLVWSHRKRTELLEIFLSAPLVSRLVGSQSANKSNIVFIVLGVFLMILALSQPRWGYRWEDLRREGVDIIIALDVSNSMLAQDIKPNRLERAKRKIADLLDMLEGDRVGLVAFAGTSYLQTPLTLDYGAARIFLNAIDTELIPVQGTAIGHAIRTAVKAFNTQDTRSRAIILITDGEDQTGEALDAAKWASEQKVKIFAIGIGAGLGAPIPNTDSAGFKKDASGEVVLSKLDETTLQNIALETGGSYVRSVTEDIDLQKVYLENIKRKVDKREITTERRKKWTERFQWFIGLALLCLSHDYFRRHSQPGA